MTDVRIRMFRPHFLREEHWDILGNFDAKVGDFALQKTALKRCRKDGHFEIALVSAGSRSTRHISLPPNCPTRTAITEAAALAWRRTYDE